MADDLTKPRTHTAFAYRREGPRMRCGRWLEIGNARIEQPPCPHCGAPAAAQQAGQETGFQHVFLDRLPLGAFTGYVMLAPIGTEPPLPQPKPKRPGEADDDDADE